MLREIVAYGSIISLLVLLAWAVIQIHNLGRMNTSDAESMINRVEERTRYKQAIEDVVLPSEMFTDMEMMEK